MRFTHKPTEMEFFAPDDAPFLVRYDYDAGEEQWFDARAGVGSPGYPASVQLTEVNFGAKWETPDAYPQLDVEAIEHEIMERIDQEAEAFFAEYANRDREAQS
jgi:hypothetical protein